jgi:hypothetical protein
MMTSVTAISVRSVNDRTTPRIVLDIFGIDPKLDPEPLLFKSIGEASKALNTPKCTLDCTSLKATLFREFFVHL